MPTPTRTKPLGILPDGKKHVPGSGLFGGASMYPPGVKVGEFDKVVREADKAKKEK